jgi:hypothetical protein
MATRTYHLLPVQAADAAIPADCHKARIRLKVVAGDVLRLEWYDVADVGSPTAALVAITVVVTEGAVRFRNNHAIEDADPRFDAPANITISTGIYSLFEPIGASCTIELDVYVDDVDGVAEYVAA